VFFWERVGRFGRDWRGESAAKRRKASAPRWRASAAMSVAAVLPIAARTMDGMRLSALRLPLALFLARGGWHDFVSKTRRGCVAGTLTLVYLSPPRGERSSEARVRGPLRDSEHRKSERPSTPPHPDLLPACGEKECAAGRHERCVYAARTDHATPLRQRVRVGRSTGFASMTFVCSMMLQIRPSKFSRSSARRRPIHGWPETQNRDEGNPAVGGER
jgi:hypothetical protein